MKSAFPRYDPEPARVAEMPAACPPDAVRPSPASGPRARCLRKLRSLAGPGGAAAFLRTRQPAMDDRTGAWLLENDPARLLAALANLERGLDAADAADSAHDPDVVDPDDADPTAREEAALP